MKWLVKYTAMVKTVVNKENRGSSFRGLESWV